MICLVLPLLIGFGIDCVLGDPHSLPHPVVLIGKTISALECVLRRIFAKTPRGERAAGAVLWLIVAFLATAVPALLLCLCGRVSPWLRLAVESVMCWQILAAKSLRDESMKVYHELEHGSIESARRGRDRGGEHVRRRGRTAAVPCHRRRAAGLFLQGCEYDGLDARLRRAAV